MVTSPEQHAATVREPLQQALDEVRRITRDMPPERAEYYERLPLARLAALDELVALASEAERLAGRADCGGVNCGKCQQCLTAHEFFLKEAVENGDKLLSQAGRALEAAEARADELQRELDEIADLTTQEGRQEQNIRSLYKGREQARREADQLRAAAKYAVRMLNDPYEYEIGEVVDRIEQAVNALNAALAGVQAEEQTT